MMLIFLYVLCALFLLVVLWILFVPVKVVGSTITDRLEISQTGTFLMKFYDQDKFCFKFFVFGVPVRAGAKPEKEVPKSKKGKSKFPERTSEQWRKLIRSVLRSVRVKKCFVNVDTDDMTSNAMLIPAGVFLSNDKFRLTSNFEGRLLIDVELSILIHYIVWAVIIFFLTKK